MCVRNHKFKLGVIIIYSRIRKTLSIVCALSLLSVLFLQPISAQTEKVAINQEKITTIEAYTIETYSNTKNAEGFYVLSGYEVVNSVTEIISDGGKAVSASVNSISDNYDLNGEYKYTTVQSNQMENNFQTGKARSQNSKIETYEPQNEKRNLNNFIENNDTFENFELTEIEKQNIVKKIAYHKTYMPYTEYIDIQGVTFDDLENVKQRIQMNQTLSTVSECPTSNTPGVEACGAFDNFYRHNIINGDFTVQALCCAGDDSIYAKLHGSIGTDTDKAKRLSDFKRYINTYERYLVDDMNSNTTWEVIGWASAIASFVLLVQGFATGPVGWVAVASTYFNALLVFAGLTSSQYATSSRLAISKNVAAQLENASSQALLMLQKNDMNYSFSFVSGF